MATLSVLYWPEGHAAAVTYTDGDLFVGFRATGGQGATQTYLVNIGQASIYRDATSGSSINLSLGNIGVDLVALYGSDWNTRADLFWGVAGATSVANATDPANTLYASHGETQPGTLEPAWARRSNSAQTATVSKVQGVASGYLNDQQGSNDTNGATAIIENTSDPNNWASYQPNGVNSTAGSAFGVYSPGIENTFGSGAANSRLDLFRMVRTGIDDGSGATAGLGSYEGTFTIAPSGQIAYLVVPEPSTMSMLGLAGVLALGRRLRNRRIPLSELY